MRRILAVLALMAAALVATPASANADYAWALVKDGQTSDNVTGVQYLLSSHDIATDADGVFGPATLESVTAFQSDNGLDADGVVGEDTWSALITTVKNGSSGDAVKAAQTMLNKYGYELEVNGTFDDTTEEATLAFQEKFGLDADGVVGPNTWRYLSAAPAGGSDGWSLPVPSDAQPRSEYDDPHHDYPALDLAVPTGTEALAVSSGSATAFVDDSCGNGVTLTVDGGSYTYCHFDSHAFSGTQDVSAGQLLGYTGTTGNSTGPHLHFAVRDSAGTSRCPQEMLLAIYDGSDVPTIDSLATSGCSY